MWVPMGAQVPVFLPNDHPNPSQGQCKGFMKNRISKNLHVPLNNLSSVKTAKFPLARGHMGGADCGYLELGPVTPPWVRESIYKKKLLQNQCSIRTQRPQYAKKSPPPGKQGTQVRGGGGVTGVKIQKNPWRIIFGPKMMILQKVRCQKPCIGVCYANDPKKGKYTTLAPALDPIISL